MSRELFVRLLRRQSTRCYRHFKAAIKRGIDVVGAGSALLVAAPLLLAAALAIKLDTKGPVFYYQSRVGEDGRQFRCWKFRSMVVDADSLKDSLEAAHGASGGIRFKLVDDPRITRVGAVLRRFSIDEMPQLFNVLIGDMTLVGPRPPVPREVVRYNALERRRLEVRPGITCIWQVSGRSLLSFERQVELDLEYIHQAGIGRDLQLLLQTVPAVLSGRGAC